MPSYALAAGVRFYALDASSLWSDEGNTWALIQRSFAEIARDAAADIHPPGYYWLLKVWTSIFGTDAYGMRSLSAVAGTLTVLMSALIARQFRSLRHHRVLFATLAALVAALNPFQIYYSQEARMYMLLALEATVVAWSVIVLVRRTLGGSMPSAPTRNRTVMLTIYGLAATVGLWTHYSFPIVLAAAGTAYLIYWLRDRRRDRQTERLPLLGFLGANLVAFILFLPWLPTAVTQVLGWPKGDNPVSLANGVVVTLRVLLFGPLRDTPDPIWPWLAVAAILPMIGATAIARQRGSVTIMLWLMAPIALMFGFGLFSTAFLKFLLISSPAWCILVAAAPHVVSLERSADDIAGRTQTTVATQILQLLVTLGAVLLAIQTLPAYYSASDARDNYQDVARFLRTVADPESDLVLLNAPGQQEVWRYYDPGLPVLALPASRPADQGETEQALDAATKGKARVFALFWATDEADPDQIVEGWLDRNGFEGPDTWQGNMRFVTYRLRSELACRTLSTPPPTFGGLAALTSVCLPDNSVDPGDIVPMSLVWQAQGKTEVRYAVSIQLHDSQGRVIAQHDGEPSGGSRPTSSWADGEQIHDNHGLFIPFGTPPGNYRLVIALYDPVTGLRRSTALGDLVEIGRLTVLRPEKAAPAELIPMDYRTPTQIGPLTLLGYDRHRLGFAHAPDSPLGPGDTVEFIFYWQAPLPLPTDWPSKTVLELAIGADWTSAEIAPEYPTDRWTAGEVVRTVITTLYSGGDGRVRLRIDGDEVELSTLLE